MWHDEPVPRWLPKVKQGIYHLINTLDNAKGVRACISTLMNAFDKGENTSLYSKVRLRVTWKKNGAEPKKNNKQ